MSIILIILIILYYQNREKISEWIFKNDHYHLIEKICDFFKPIDVCILCTRYDKIFGNYISSQMKKSFKCCLLIKNWNGNEKIPKKFLRIFLKSRRLVIILSEYFDENEWKEWSYSNIRTRIIFITKGNLRTDHIKLVNKTGVKFNDPCFWDKLRHSIDHRKEMTHKTEFDEHEPLNVPDL